MPTAERYQQYELLRREDGSLWELGRGAMGITYKAYDTNLHFTVALKVINSVYLEKDTARQRFLREARAAAALRHPNVASVFNLGTDQDSYFYVMEFIDGETIEAYVKRKGRLDPAEALNIALQVARALGVAAKLQLVHRDLKPTNLMLLDQEGEPTVKVIDFGLAKVAVEGGEDSGALTMGGFVGTPHFASPEQVEEGEVDIRSDIYSLGATLYFMLAGQCPFSGSVGQVMSQHLYKPLPTEPLTGLPPCVVSLLHRMMEKNRNDRPQTPQDLQKVILACLDDIRGSSGRGIYQAGEVSSASATLDLSPSSRTPLVAGAVLAQSYQIIEELFESPQGRRFLAADIQRKRRVSLLVLSLEFLSDGTSLARLEEAVNLLHNAPHPGLREIYSLETVSDCSFLVEEHVVGPSLLDVLRLRGVLSAPEVVRLLGLLAPVADHASAHQLLHIGLTLSGIHLTNRASSGSGNQSELLHRLITAWEPLEPKVDAVDFSFLRSDTGTWAGSATHIPGTAGGGPRDSCVRLLSLLAYELLGGLRARVEATGQYTPLATLTQEGNAVLRRALVDECRSAGELAGQLAAAVGVLGPAAPVSAGAKTFTPEALPRTPPPKPPAEVPVKRKFRISPWGWVLALGFIVALGIFGSYAIYRSLHPPAAPQQSPPHEIAALSVQSVPVGATILLDGKPPQAAPNTFTHVPFGTHELRATLDDYEPIKQELEVRQGMTSEIHLKLTPSQAIAALSVQSEPPGAAILLDGKPPQVPPNTFTHVPIGTHELTGTLEDYEPIKQDIQVHRGMTPEIHLRLTPSQAIAALSVQSEPPGAAILLDGKPPQVPPNTFTHVPFGTHELKATLENYEPIKQDIQVRRGMTPEIHLRLTPSQEIAALSVQSEPTGAAIFLDGKPPQAPPNTFTHVPFGSHELIATLNKYEPAKQDIQVRAGMAPEVHVKLKQSPSDEIAWILSLEQGRLDEARKEVAEALQTYRELAQRYETYRPDVARTLNNLAILDSRQSRMEEARKEFAEALQIYGELAQKNDETYRPFIATTLNNLGNVDLDQGKLDEARKELAEALQIRRELAQKNPETYRPFVARTLNNLAILDRRQNRIEEARKEFAEALETDRELAQKNPDAYRSFVATTLNNLGNVDLDQGKLDEARKEFEEALQIRRELAQKNPEIYRPYAAMTLSNLAVIDGRQGRMEEARKKYGEVLQTYRELAQKNQEAYRPSIAATLNNLGNVDFEQHKLDEARKDFAEALEIYEILAKQDPGQFMPKVARLKKVLEQLSSIGKTPGKVHADQ
jgi:serine/threonine protein kinase/tetratricopeptide (TPR) repeat protein/chaperone required for assembly of F1-ATPase